MIALPIKRRFLVGGEQEGDEDEGLEPGDVGVEPVVDGELEGDDQRRGERREPPDRPLLQHHGDDEGEEDHRRREDLLQDLERRDLGEDGPRGLPPALEEQGPVG